MKWVRLNNGDIYQCSNPGMYKEGVIKKQGDSLINVLEVGDIIIPKSISISTSMIVSIGDLFISTLADGNIRTKQIKRVITHEQYMPLAQEVSNDT